MDSYQALYQLAKTLLAGGEDHSLPEFLLRRVARLTGAAYGLIVLNEEGQFNEKSSIGFDLEASGEQKRLCRSLVRRAIAQRDMVTSGDLGTDKRFHGVQSVQGKMGVAAMAVPLTEGGDLYAVVYLEKAVGHAPFTEDDQFLLREFADMAGIALRLALERDYLTRLKKHRTGVLQDFDFGEIICRHPKMLAVLELVAQVADSDAAVLISGETGTGKELIARAIFQNSKRKQQPFLTLHCGALPENLFEAELFGHRKGAFTGADRDRAGRIAQASGGTLFIDEVAEIPLAVQAKLLRFFQFGEYQRIGSDRVETVDTRIIAATHQDLKKLVEQGRFRQDLYYRLNVIELTLPPLRERRSDIPFLIEAFLKTFWRNKVDPILGSQARSALMNYAYPGNVRELAHALERACLVARDARIELEHLPEVFAQPSVSPSSEIPESLIFEPQSFTNEELKTLRQQASQAVLLHLESKFCQGLLARHDGNVAQAAEAAGLQKTYLYKLIARTQGSDS